MTRWDMVYKIKILHDNGHGSSIRGIAKELNISKNTVRKFIRMDEKEICDYLERQERTKKLDTYKSWFIHQLEKYPKLTAVKMMRKLKDKGVDVDVSNRTMRRYIGRLKGTIATKQKRYYEPVLDMVPGVQCQVDPGESRNVKVGTRFMHIYFVVFVLSYSRLMYASASIRPITTETFIHMHDEAFRYFNGIVDECVYDQTKLVALHEEYREVQYNQRFYQYATKSHFDIRVCEGYDPESKGKVEAGVKYVKQDFLYGETFDSIEDLSYRLTKWLNNVANARIHGTTGLIPREVYNDKEHIKMKPYISTMPVSQTHILNAIRKVDKTGLISYKANKYSVPMPYQGAQVFVREEGNILIISQKKTGEKIAEHTLGSNKGKIYKNTNHYRDFKKTLADHENEIRACLSDDLTGQLCMVLKNTSPKIYKDQLVGLKKVLSSYKNIENLEENLAILADRPSLTVSFIRDYLEAVALKPFEENEATVVKKQHGYHGELMKYSHLKSENTCNKEVFNNAIL